MAKPFERLLEEFTPEERGEIEAHTQALIAEYEFLSALRKARKLTQKDLAKLMEVRQASISKLERQHDILVGTLNNYIRALGGELEIRAKFPDGVVTLSQFTRRDTSGG
jgi:transcriptional regulator with XRE-family HTH domain